MRRACGISGPGPGDGLLPRVPPRLAGRYDAPRMQALSRRRRATGRNLTAASSVWAAFAAFAAAQPPQTWRDLAREHVAAARGRTLAACAERGFALPTDFVAWVDADPIRQASVYGCRQDPLRVLLQLRSLEIDLGPDLVRTRYPQLALAFAIQGSYRPTGKKASGWNDGDDGEPDAPLPDVSPRPPLALAIPGDPRVRVDTRDPARELDRDDHIVNFLEDHAPMPCEGPGKEPSVRPLVAADVIADPALQAEFNLYMQAHGHPETQLDCGDHAVRWFAHDAVKDKELRTRIAAAWELFHGAYRHKGRMPAERDAAPTPAESMAWFVRNDRHAFAAEDKAARGWPRFPLNAPWPALLMLAADDQPLREREDIWLRFRDRGELKTYGEYIGGIAQQFDMQSARRVSPFAFSYGSIQMMWKDGGVCGTMGNIGARTWRICGVPASTAGQPGHCAIVFWTFDAETGRYGVKGGQYATGGDEVTTVHAGWNYDDRGARRGMVWHQSVAWGIDHDFAAFVDTLVMQRAFAAMPAAAQKGAAGALLAEGLAANPFAFAIVDAAVRASDEPEALVAQLDAFAQALDTVAGAGEYGLYRTTVRDLVHARIAELPASATTERSAALLRELERQGCTDARLLARCWRALGGDVGFGERCAAAVAAYLASPARTKNRAESARFARWLETIAKTVEGRQARRVWAEALLIGFAGREALVIRKKTSLDPAVAALCKIAGRAVPEVAK